MLKTFLLTLLVIAVAGCSEMEPHRTEALLPAEAYYVRLTPQPPDGASCLMGFWTSYAAAADFDGSAHYLHSFNCHETGTPPDCDPILGNGFAYPLDYPYVNKGNVRVPSDKQIPSSGPILLPTTGNPHQVGLYGLYYPNSGGCVVFPAAERPKYKALVAAKKGVFPAYRDWRCPGWPNLLIGVNYPDGVCN